MADAAGLIPARRQIMSQINILFLIRADIETITSCQQSIIQQGIILYFILPPN
jgi:hypothetical protein